MSRPVPFRKDFNGDDLRRLSRSSTDAKQARRLLTISLIYDGATRSEAARHGNVDVQSIRDWVLRFNAEAGAGRRNFRWKANHIRELAPACKQNSNARAQG